MASGKKRVTLERVPSGNGGPAKYLVIRATNTLDPEVRSMLTEKEVLDLKSRGVDYDVVGPSNR